MYYDAVKTGHRIKTLRKERGLTQEQLAALLEVTDRHVRNIETGQRNASIDFLVDVSKLFGVSLDYLILGKPDNRQVKEGLFAILETISDMAEKL